MKTNREIAIKELSKIHGEYMVAKALAIISGEYYKNEDEWKNKFFEPLASTLLSKLQTLDRRKIKKIISKYTKPNMLQWTHQIDKSKPVATCFYSKEDYENCINEILSLIPAEGEVIFKAKLKKGVNLSKVIEQILYPKYINKEIIIREVKQ